MKKAFVPVLVCVLLLAGGCAAAFYGHEYYGAVVALLGVLVIFDASKKYTYTMHAWLLVVSSLTAMLILHSLTGKQFSFFPLLGLSFSLGYTIRGFLYKQLLYNRYLYLDAFIQLIAVASYVAANVFSPIGWQGWVLPLPMIVFSLFHILGIFMDQKMYKDTTSKALPLAVGNPVNTFSLPDQQGNLFDTASLKDVAHYLLVFIRGDWCPACHVKIRTYYNEREKFKAKNVKVIMISPDTIDVNSDMMDRLAVDFTILADEKCEAGKKFNVLCHDNYPMTKYSEGIPLPSAFLVDKKGILRYASTPAKLGEYLDPRTIFPILDSL